MLYICSEAVICDLPHYVGMFIIIIFVSQIALSKYISLLWGSSELQTFKIFLYLRRWWVLVTVKLIFLFMLCTPGREWCEILLFKYYIELFLYFEGIWCNERVFISYILGLPPVTKAIIFLLYFWCLPIQSYTCCIYVCFYDPPFEPLFPCWGKV